ncbi:MAG: hypothetical protein OXI53_12235 [Nitrospira sp.]|nr:hypothetical protein [Nitrospira sp.]
MEQTLIPDTHSFVKEMEAAGMPQPVAEAFVKNYTKYLLGNLATKQDIEGLQAATQKDIAGVQKDIAGLQKETAELKKETAGLNKEIVAVRQDLSDKTILIIKWNVGTVLAVAGLLLAPAARFL